MIEEQVSPIGVMNKSDAPIDNIQRALDVLMMTFGFDKALVMLIKNKPGGRYDANLSTVAIGDKKEIIGFLRKMIAELEGAVMRDLKVNKKAPNK